VAPLNVPPLQVAAWCDRTTSHPPRAATVVCTLFVANKFDLICLTQYAEIIDLCSYRIAMSYLALVVPSGECLLESL